MEKVLRFTDRYEKSKIKIKMQTQRSIDRNTLRQRVEKIIS